MSQQSQVPGFRMALNRSTSLPYGIGLADEDATSKALEAMEIQAMGNKPEFVSAKVDALIGMMQQIHVTTRDNNAILNQLLSKMEERLNSRIDQVREEMIALINSKLPSSASTTSASSVQFSADGRSRPRAPPIAPDKASRRPTLSKIFEGMEGTVVELGETSKSVYETVTVTPNSGFVIKTRKLLGTKDKVFINIFHHEYIELEPAHVAKANSADNRPYLVTGEKSNILDKDGHNCTVFNVAVSSEYFKQDNNLDLKITSPASIHKIIHKVNIKFNEFLDESSYVLPRSSTGYKGEELAQFKVLVPVRSVTPLSSPLTNSSSAPDTSSATGANPRMSFNRSGGIADTSSFTLSQSYTQDSDSVVSELTNDAPAPNRQGSLLSVDRTSFETTGASAQWETGSAISSGNGPPSSTKKKVPRKSIFDTRQLSINEGNIAGRNLLSSDMLRYVKEDSVDNNTAESLKKASVDNPSLLLGWQVSLIDLNKKAELYVVTSVRKNYLSKTEFRVSRFNVDDAWVRLKRDEGKSGLEFRPMRKVLFGLADDDETSIP